MDLCYYFRKLFNKKSDYDYNILNNDNIDKKEICTIYCPKCGYNINYYK